MWITTFYFPSGCPIRYAPAPSTPRIGCPLALTQKPLRKSGFFVCAISPPLATRIREEPGRAGIVHKPEGLGIADRSLAVNWNGVQGNWKQLSGRMQERWGRLTHNNLRIMAGRRDRIIGGMQASYGVAKEKAEHRLRALKNLLERGNRTRH
jgi:uncharacterized protein YjbJ (UPF0337 family)